MDDIDSSLD